MGGASIRGGACNRQNTVCAHNFLYFQDNIQWIILCFDVFRSSVYQKKTTNPLSGVRSPARKTAAPRGRQGKSAEEVGF